VGEAEGRESLLSAERDREVSMAVLTDEKKILELAADLRAFGVDPVDILRHQVMAEGYCERRLIDNKPETLAEVLRANRISSFPDVFESPTFRARLRQLRLDSEGWTGEPPKKTTQPDGSVVYEHPPMNMATVYDALEHLRQIGAALARTPDRAAHRPSMKDQEWEQTAETGRDGAKEYQRVEDLQRNVSMYFALLKQAHAASRGLAAEAAIGENLRSNPFINPSFEPILTKTLAALRSQGAAKDRLTLKDAAVLLAYRREVDPKNKNWARSKSDALRKRKA
jgi:hypothetical protein